jgi:hypothetical protein
MNKKIKENGNGTNNETTKPATVITTPIRKPFFAIRLFSSLSMKKIMRPPMKAKKMGKRNQALLGGFLVAAGGGEGVLMPLLWVIGKDKLCFCKVVVATKVFTWLLVLECHSVVAWGFDWRSIYVIEWSVWA